MTNPLMTAPEQLSDDELAESLRDRFRSEAGGALHGIRVRCRFGIVTLTGVAADAQLVQIAQQIVEREVGLKAIDRITIMPVPAQSQQSERALRLCRDMPASYDLGMGIEFATEPFGNR